MTRTTRSSAVADKHDGEQENSNKLAPSAVTKKRKRASNPFPDSQDQPATKQPRTDEAQQPKIPSVGDLPLNSHHALKILDILASIDTQSLLDRLVPLPSKETPNSLRSLLRDASQHTLSLLRSAVHHLRPDSSRSRSSEQQSQFYNLALSLLERASFHNVQLPDDIESILPRDTDSAPDDVALSRAEPKFALVQHLPQGDYWTSLSTENVGPSLATGHAELVSIIPYPSSSSTIPRLSTLHMTKPDKKQKLPEPRIFHTGSVLDYGPWTSFAPTFDQEAADIGQRQLSEFYYYRELKRRKREEERRQDHAVVEVEMEDVVMQDAAPDQAIPIDPELDGLLPSDQLSGIKDALSSLELENSIQELLDKNQRALARLQELQFLRLTASEGKLSIVEEGSEEWETANAILESLTLLASLRPRSSQEDSSPLIPPPSVLHTLHQTLPLFDLHGWSGTLPSGSMALRDDSTVKVRAGSGTQTIATPAPTPATVAPSLAVPFAGYYSTPGQYRPATGTNQYASQAKSYYPNYVGQQGVPASYYGAQGYPGVGATGQQPYSTFTGWFGNYTAAAVAASASGTPSGRGTPQPAAAAAVSPYGSYFAANTNIQQKSPVVANTVVAKQWSAGLYPQGAVPTLPAHVRSNSLQNGQQ